MGNVSVTDYGPVAIANALQGNLPSGVLSQLERNTISVDHNRDIYGQTNLSTTGRAALQQTCDLLDPGSTYIASTNNQSDVGIVADYSNGSWSTIDSGATESYSCQTCTGSGRSRTCTYGSCSRFSNHWLESISCAS